jgi:DnaK suppressor protein
MNKAQLKKFRSLLEEKRDEIVKKAKQTLDEDMTLDANDLPDEMDLASSEYLQSCTVSMRGREK